MVEEHPGSLESNALGSSPSPPLAGLWPCSSFLEACVLLSIKWSCYYPAVQGVGEMNEENAHEALSMEPGT